MERGFLWHLMEQFFAVLSSIPAEGKLHVALHFHSAFLVNLQVRSAKMLSHTVSGFLS